MRRLLNTLFITSEDVYLSLDGENVVANRDGAQLARYPLHTLQSIVSFSYAGASPALMGACAERDVALLFCTPQGRFLARVTGKTRGNVLLRRTQYRVADDDRRSAAIAACMTSGKVYNARRSIERTRRDHAMRIDDALFGDVSARLKALLPNIMAATDRETLRGLEGMAAVNYFRAFGEQVLVDRQTFRFNGRNRRPPLDPMNAMLSFAYTLLGHDCAAALECAGLDPAVGFLHCDRSGRDSLALDLMEELRPCMADRFVLSLVNNRVLQKDDFETTESGAVLMTDAARKRFLAQWQEKKRDTLTHPFLEEKIPWGLLPYVQALLLARHLRGDLDAYPPFLWR